MPFNIGYRSINLDNAKMSQNLRQNLSKGYFVPMVNQYKRRGEK